MMTEMIKPHFILDIHLLLCLLFVFMSILFYFIYSIENCGSVISAFSFLVLPHTTKLEFTHHHVDSKLFYLFL